jgi:ElaB/YqjD/DUF883 family membrane-anchored ribosome-binding protein
MQNTGMQGSTPSATSTGRYGEKLADRASDTFNRLSESAQQTLDRVSDAASQTAGRLSEKGQELWERRGEAVDTARSYVREHPVATIGIALAIGLLISRLTSRR